MVFAFDSFINRYKRTSATVLRERINIQFFFGGGGGGGGVVGGQNIVAIIFWPAPFIDPFLAHIKYKSIWLDIQMVFKS